MTIPRPSRVPRRRQPLIAILTLVCLGLGVTALGEGEAEPVASDEANVEAAAAAEAPADGVADEGEVEDDSGCCGGDDGEPAETELDEVAWQSVRDILGVEAELKDGVLRVVVPRSDLFVTMEGNEIPAGAGLESDFRFYRCECGHINVMGQFCVEDYEANDVVAELQAGRMLVASVGPLLLGERPRLLIIRFQGEANFARELAEPIKAALERTGEARSAPIKFRTTDEGEEDEGVNG